ncbi:MAG: ABC-type bacteriocin/lantibiotic exporter with double-glycine peptidase domain [Bacteroidia bacterium]|jgi:ABC-type bacteriocin/lantibiotic exporter with double-glycine peptidase domain
MSNPMTPVRRFFNLLKVDKQEILSIYVYAIFHGLVTLSLPLGIQAIINLITGGQVSTSWIVMVIFVILGVAFTGVLQIMQLTISENIQQKIFTRSAFEFAYRIPRMKLEAVDRDYIPELVNRFFDTLSVQKGLSKILMDFSSASLQVLFGLVLLSLYHPFFILFSVLLIAIAYLVFRISGPRGLSTSIAESHYKYEVAHWLEEVARAMETFKLAGDSPLPLQKTDEKVEGYLKSRKAHFRTLITQYINLVGLKVFIVAGLLIIGGLLVINQQMNIGQFVASEIIIILILGSIEKLILSMETIYDVLTALEKIGNVTDLPLDRDNGSRFDKDNEKGVSIQMKDVSYTFLGEKEDFLKNISLNLASGEKVCLSGYNGSGKSLLLQFLAGLYDEFRGTISYNDVPIGNWFKEDLHKVIGDNLIKEEIFKGTLMENITLGKPYISLDEVKKMSAVVGLQDFVSNQQFGYNTMMLPEGRNLPKSTRLKIILTRSLVGKPNVILIENSFNQLNEKDKTSFINYLKRTNSTVVVISNDVHVAKLFERIIVLKDGAIMSDSAFEKTKKATWFNEIFQTN